MFELGSVGERNKIMKDFVLLRRWLRKGGEGGIIKEV